MAEKLVSDAGTSLDSQILAAYHKFYGRSASTEEIEDAGNFIKAHSLTDFCRAMFNSNEFLFTF